MLDKLYANRFNKQEIRQKDMMWKVLCSSFFQRYINRDAAVLDIGAGYAEFINNIECAEKFAVDLNEDTGKFLNPGVKFFRAPSTDLSDMADDSMDAVFMSNFLEHLETKADIIKTLQEIRRVLKPGGRVMILGPNIKYLYKEYWDFFDHHIPLNSESLVEALQMTGFEIEQALAKFLPYTTKSKIPKTTILIRAYLKMPLIWKIMGRQMFVVSRKPEEKRG